jgi:hypothetical protein
VNDARLDLPQERETTNWQLLAAVVGRVLESA